MNKTSFAETGMMIRENLIFPCKDTGNYTSEAGCRKISSIIFSNETSCAGKCCRSPWRVCKACSLAGKADSGRKVVDAETGLCQVHVDHEEEERKNSFRKVPELSLEIDKQPEDEDLEPEETDDSIPSVSDVDIPEISESDSGTEEDSAPKIDEQPEDKDLKPEESEDSGTAHKCLICGDSLNEEKCRELSGISQYNSRCTEENCDSPWRVCKVCSQPGEENSGGEVVNAKTGLCKVHADSEEKARRDEFKEVTELSPEIGEQPETKGKVENIPKFSNFLTESLEKLGLDIQALAEKSRLSVNCLKRLEKGEPTSFKFGMARVLIKALQLDKEGIETFILSASKSKVISTGQVNELADAIVGLLKEIEKEKQRGEKRNGKSVISTAGQEDNFETEEIVDPTSSVQEVDISKVDEPAEQIKLTKEVKNMSANSARQFVRRKIESGGLSSITKKREWSPKDDFKKLKLFVYRTFDALNIILDLGPERIIELFFNRETKDKKMILEYLDKIILKLQKLRDTVYNEDSNKNDVKSSVKELWGDFKEE